VRVAKTEGCWASSLDDCMVALSDEHILPIAVWQTDNETANRAAREQSTVIVHEPDGTQRNIMAVDFKASILCCGHNAATSELDVALGSFAKGLHRLHRRLHGASVREEILNVNGSRLERALMKVAINYSVNQRYPYSIGAPHRRTDWAVSLRRSRRPVELRAGLRLQGVGSSREVPRRSGSCVSRFPFRRQS
jgi:hypothetical protein